MAVAAALAPAAARSPAWPRVPRGGTRAHTAAAPAPATRSTFIWDSRFGRIDITVDGDDVWVNGQWVEPAPPDARQRA